MKRRLLLLGGLALALVFVFLMVWSDRRESKRPVVVPVSPEPRDIVLYFADSTATGLVSEERQIPGCNDERQCIAQTIEALAAGSRSLQPILPEETRILGVKLEGDLALINFSRELVDRHPGGSLSELLTVYGLTNTLAVNFPYLRKLQILVDGKAQSTLRGHVDIGHPIKAEFLYSSAPADDEGRLLPSAVDTGSNISEDEN